MKKLSIAEPVTALRHVPIVDNGEPLVNFLEVCPDLLLDKPRFTYRRETFARVSVARMLCEANATLMKQGYRLAIVEGWRPQHIQKRMHMGIWNRLRERYPEWSDTKLRRKANQFTAPLNKRVPPPHSTGGAVDLVLCNMDGKVQDHTSPYEAYDPACYFFAAKGLSETALRNRQLLWDALTPTGMTNYPSEYWHWTYGDQGWAYRGGHPHALYGAVEPPGYEPEPADVSDEALVLLQVEQGRTADPKKG
jgi:D-alanyl-D-alanine dipeptidase